MTPERREAIEALFEEALDQRPAMRRGWLAMRCGADAELHDEVTALLDAHERAAGILEANASPYAAAALAEPMPAEGSERRIAHYRVIRELGRGGMGVVYLAERDDGQFHQRVAVKLLRSGPDAEELRKRFLSERQILATLRHPNIAQLLDGGVTDGELPYLVMEYVEGEPITDFCDRTRMSIEGRLALFKDVCGAVHHAHQNLVLHRDIKPGNILVTETGRVHLLDFGIAKLLDASRGVAATTVTHAMFRPMTPEYASPEQVRGEPLTTSSDVYALGVVLYELLTGRRPYQLSGASLPEVARVVCEQEPERPSVVAPERLRRTLRGDLDAIVMMALRKEPRGRYGSADVLWADLQRYRDGLPVHAHRGSRVYRARKFLARHTVETAASALVALSLVGGVAIALRQATAAGRERDRAARALAQAEQALAQSEGVTEFLVGLFDATQPQQGTAAGVTARDVLRRGSTQVEALAREPLLQARMLEALGRVPAAMGEYPQSRTAFERSLAVRRRELGEGHAEVATTMFHLAEVLRRQGHYAESQAMAERVLSMRTRLFGDRHPSVAEALTQLSGLAIYHGNEAAAETLAARAVAIRRATLGTNTPVTATSLEQYAGVLRRRGKTTEAIALLREGIEIHRRTEGPGAAAAADLELRLAAVLLDVRGDSAEAERLVRDALASLRSTLGDGHPRVGWAMRELGALVAQRGRIGEGERLVRQAVDIHRRVFGADHPFVAEGLGVIAAIARRDGRPAEAERVQRDAVRMWQTAFGPTHQGTAGALGGLGEILADLGRYDEAVEAARTGLRIRQELAGADALISGIATSVLASVYAQTGDYASADSLFDRALVIVRRRVPEEHPDVRAIYGRMAERYRRAGNAKEASRYRTLAAVTR